MMKYSERLEEIKQTINHPNYTEHNGQEEIYFMVSDNDFNWLIKQAERAQKNAQDLEDMDRQLYSEQQQNKRYKQALEEILNADCNLEGLDAERELDRVTDIALEALEE